MTFDKRQTKKETNQPTNKQKINTQNIPHHTKKQTNTKNKQTNNPTYVLRRLERIGHVTHDLRDIFALEDVRVVVLGHRRDFHDVTAVPPGPAARGGSQFGALWFSGLVRLYFVIVCNCLVFVFFWCYGCLVFLLL